MLDDVGVDRVLVGKVSSASFHVNTLLLQRVLEDPVFRDSFENNDRRALSPRFWGNINPYGRFRLDMDTRLDVTKMPA